MRKLYVFDREIQKMIPAEEYYAKQRKPNGQSAAVIQDTMDAVAHPCTGQLMDSKSEFRKVTKAHGCTEVGNEKPDYRPAEFKSDPVGRREAIKQALQEHGVKL